MTDEDMLSWIDERFIKSFVKIHTLSLIASGHRHGYDIMKHIEKEHGVRVSAGSYYPVLQWLEERGYIKGGWEHQPEGKPDRKTYEVTREGREVLETAKARLMSLSKGLCTGK